MPTVMLSGPPGTAGPTVQIELSISQTPQDVVLAFGDGTNRDLGSTTGAHLTHTYPSSGPYMVQATATFIDGRIVTSSTGLSIR
jgi:hypothetical protein